MDRLATRPRHASPSVPGLASSFGAALVGTVALLIASGCGELKTAPVTADGGTSGSDVDPSSPLPTKDAPAALAGPGTHGSLPSGYCCTDDSECRNRHCAEAGTGGKMCLDHCYSDSVCTRRGLAFKCDAPNQSESGFCQPPTPSFACIPQSQFQRGTRAVGECCEASGDGKAGEECEGNLCNATGKNDVDGPFVCSQWCDLTKDCPSGTVCSSEFHWCEPASFPYTCK